MGEIVCPLLIPLLLKVIFWKNMIMNYWNKLHKNEIGKVIAKAVKYISAGSK